MNSAVLLAYWNQHPTPSLALLAGTITLLTGAIIALVIFRKKRPSPPPSDSLPPDSASPPDSSPTLDSSPAPETSPSPPTLSWKERLAQALQHSSQNLSGKIHALFHQNQDLTASLEAIHKILYNADLGVSTCEELMKDLKKSLPKSSPTADDIFQCLRQKMLSMLQQDASAERIPPTPPRVVMIVGVNGVGKTTTTGKLTAHFVAKQQKVLLCAADTFRAGASDQLRIWADRTGADIIAQKPGTDPAAVAYTAMQAGIARSIDTLIIDTAGRLHNKQNLMDQLQKIHRVVKKLLPAAPHEIWMVIDGTTGSNAISQVQAFKNMVPITGLIVTKLDGTAKGGAVVGVSYHEKIPIRYIGIGEEAADLQPFNGEDFVAGLLKKPS